MVKTYLHRCAHKVWKGYHDERCSRDGVIERDGKWYCKQHDPIAIEAKRKADHDKWEREWAADKAKLHRAAVVDALMSDFPIEAIEAHTEEIKKAIAEIVKNEDTR